MPDRLEHASIDYNSKIADFIPIACHYNKNTLLTKNGELIQIIKVKGFVKSQDDISTSDLRAAVREAISTHITSLHYGVYIYVTRDYEDASPAGYFQNDFARKLNEAWCKSNTWDRQLLNTLYIAVVHQGLKGHLGLHKALYNALFALLKKRSFAPLDKCADEMTKVVVQLSNSLSQYGSTILGIRPQPDKTGISELLSLYHYLLYMHHKDIEVDVYDLAKHLSRNASINYLPNTLEINKNDVHKKYAAIYSMKHRYLLSDKILDSILRFSSRFMIAENFYFAPKHLATAVWKQFYDVYTSAKATDMIQLGQLDALLDQNREKNVRYCEQQITFTIYDDCYDNFVLQTSKFADLLKELGLIMIREDLYLPGASYAKLPGNAKYLKRKFYNTISNVGMFTSIHPKAIGNYVGSKWGPVVTIFHNIIDKLPYYFNFHNEEDAGHTLVIGEHDTGVGTLTRFLLTQSMKFNYKIINVDVEVGKHNKNFIQAIGGTSIDLAINSDEVQEIQCDVFNFGMDHVEKLFSLLEKCVICMMLSAEDKFNITDMLKEIMQAEATTRQQVIANIIEKIHLDSSTTAVKRFVEFLKSEFYKQLLSKDALDPIIKHKILNINLNKIYEQNSEYGVLLATLIFMKFPSLLSNADCNIVSSDYMDFAVKCGETGIDISNLLDEITALNGICVFTLREKEYIAQYQYVDEVLAKFKTKIFMPHKFVDKTYKKIFQLSDWEAHQIKLHDKNARIFLIKQQNNSIVTSFNLTNLSDIIQTIG
ncbi:putative Type IV secretion system protein VirB4 [Alphaproteobacteria bacterium]